MMNGVNNAVSFGCTYCYSPKVHENSIPFEQAQSKDDWVSGYTAAVEKFAEFASMQSKIAHNLAYEGVLSSSEEFMPQPSCVEKSPFDV